MADEPRPTNLPITATDVEHRFWTEQLEPSGKPRTSELLEEVPSFSYKDRVVSVSRKDLDALDNYLLQYGESEGLSSIPPRIRASWTVAGKKWHQDLWDRSENVPPNFPLVPTDLPQVPDEPHSMDLPTDTTLQLPGKGGPSGSVLESMEGYTRLQEIRSRERDQPSKRPLQKLISGKVPSGILNALRRGPGHTKIAMAAYDAATAAWDLLSKAQQEEVIRQVYPPLPQESEEEPYIPDAIISLIHAAAKQDREPGEFINTLIKRDLIEDTKIIRKAANKHFEDGVWLRDQGGKAAGGFIDRPLYDRAV